MNLSKAQYNAIIARKLGIRHSTARNPKSVVNVLRKGITTATVLKLFRSVYYVRGPMNRSAEIAPDVMDKTLQILQLNVRKMDMVQQSLLNDESLKDFSVLAISEPYS